MCSWIASIVKRKETERNPKKLNFQIPIFLWEEEGAATEKEVK
jgi:hypothetical protein